ncbi:hypothetical protein JXQ70_16860 [bacterium]|nr:hypothetical protein [bacterium]
MQSVQLFLNNELGLLFSILACGCLLGKIAINKIELSASGGVLFVALFLGHYGYLLPDTVSTIGFALFIYAIGFGAGPRFLQAFRRNGIKYALVALFVVIIAAVTALCCAEIFHFPRVFLPGILAGALTQTSTLAAAYEVTRDPLLSVSYGITYPFGLIGMLILIRILPQLLGIDLKQEAAQLDVNPAEDDLENGMSPNSSPLVRAYVIRESDWVGKTLRELDFRNKTGLIILSIRRNLEFFQALCETSLELGDHILVEGPLNNHLAFSQQIGPEIFDDSLLTPHSASARVVINRKQVLNKSIRELGLPQFFHVFISRFQRGSIDLEVNPDLMLERGDIVTINGPENGVKNATHFLGREEHKIFETDILTFSAGLFLGIILGQIRWPLINTSIGNAGGLLFMGILLGHLRNFGPFSGRVPVAARYVLQELGLLLFLAGIGTKAGQGLLEHLFNKGFSIFLSGVLVTSITLIATILFCRLLMRFDWNTSFGATTGGVTSTVALKIITEEADSGYPILGYAGVYAFANILLTMLGQIILLC